jgi:glycosyltransferase involved in cell wall biosynthesis
MPVHNGERFLPETLASVRAQTLAEWELLLVDDGSTDGSLEIARAAAERDPRIRLLELSHGGVAAARNAALELVRAPLVALWDQDDLAEPDRLAVQAAFLDAAPDVAVVGAYAWYVGAAGRVVGVLEFPPTTREEYARIRAGHGTLFVPGSSAVFRRDVALAVGGFRTSMEPAEDTDLWTRIGDEHVVLILPRRLVRYRVHAGSASARRFFLQRERDELHGINAARRHAGLPELDPREYHRVLGAEPLAIRARRLRVWSSRYLYRRAGGLLADGRRRGLLWLALAASLAPAMVARRLRPQVAERLRRYRRTAPTSRLP